ASRFRSNGDLYVVPERGQYAHQAVAREIRQSIVQKGGDLRLIDAHTFRRRGLGQPRPLDDLANMGGQLSLGQLLLGGGKAEIGEDVAASGRYWDFGLTLFDHRSQSSLARSITARSGPAWSFVAGVYACSGILSIRGPDGSEACHLQFPAPYVELRLWQ